MCKLGCCCDICGFGYEECRCTDEVDRVEQENKMHDEYFEGGTAVPVQCVQVVGPMRCLQCGFSIPWGAKPGEGHANDCPLSNTSQQKGQSCGRCWHVHSGGRYVCACECHNQVLNVSTSW